MATTTNNYNLRAFKLKPKFVERVWGRTDLKPWYESTGTDAKVGEAWLTGAECVIEGGDEAGRTLESWRRSARGRWTGCMGGASFRCW